MSSSNTGFGVRNVANPEQTSRILKQLFEQHGIQFITILERFLEEYGYPVARICKRTLKQALEVFTAIDGRGRWSNWNPWKFLKLSSILKELMKFLLSAGFTVLVAYCTTNFRFGA